MKKILSLLALVTAFAATAQTPQPPEIAARSYLLFDVTANQFLAQKDIDVPI
jgi:D-alanyl-D-alanine carboxypeptidase (penicillin-binding protein 5/6)